MTNMGGGRGVGRGGQRATYCTSQTCTQAQNKIATRSRLVATFGGLGSLQDRRPRCNKNTKSIRRRVMDKESWTRELMANGTQERTKERRVEEGRTVLYAVCG